LKFDLPYPPFYTEFVTSEIKFSLFLFVRGILLQEREPL